MSETEVLQEVRAALASTGRVLIWRNNTGADLVEAKGRRPARFIRYGLGVGSADLVGLLRGTARFVAFEVKAPGERLRQEQAWWAEAVRTAGGFYAVVYSVDQALSALDRAFAGEAS